MKYISIIVLGLCLTTTAFASNDVSRVQKPQVKACVASELLKRDNAINAARTTFDAAVKSASDTRRLALEAIPAGATQKQMKAARQTAKTVYLTSTKNARTIFSSARNLAKAQYKEASKNCKTVTPPIIPSNPTSQS